MGPIIKVNVQLLFGGSTEWIAFSFKCDPQNEYVSNNKLFMQTKIGNINIIFIQLKYNCDIELLSKLKMCL